MATNEIDIKINLKDQVSGKLKRVSLGLGSLAGVGSKLSTSITSMLGPIAIATTSFLAMKKAISSVASTVKLFAGFDDTMRKVKAVTKATDEEFKAMVNTAKQLGSTTRFTATQSAEALSFLGMAGFNASQAIEVLPDVLNLAAAGSLDLGVAADIATNILSGFGLEINQLSRVNDVLAETFTNSNTTLTELGEGFKYVGPIAKGVGADFEDLLAAMGKLGDAGIKGSLAGTTLRGVLEALLNPTAQEAQLMSQLDKRIGGVGLQLKNNKGQFIGFSEVVRQLEKAGLKGEEALKLFGARAGPGMAALVETGADSLEELEDKLNNVNDTTGTIAKIMEGGLGGALRSLSSAAEGFALQVGEAFGDSTINGVDTFVKLFQSLTKDLTEFVESGKMEDLTASINFFVDSLSLGLSSTISLIKEVYNVMDIAADTLAGNFDQVDDKLNDVGKSFRKVFQDRGWLGSDREIQLGFVNDQIAAYEKEINLLQEKINVNKQDLKGWRAKLLGQDAYIRQIGEHQTKVQELQEKLWTLRDTKVNLELEIKLKGLAKKEVAAAKKETEKIGTGAVDEAKSDIAKKIAEAQLEREKARIEALKANAKFFADLEVQRAKNEANLEYGNITLTQFYEERRRIIEASTAKEIELLQQQADQLTLKETEKRAKIENQIYKKKQVLNADLIKLDIEYYKAAIRQEEELTKEQDKQHKIRLEAYKAYKDLVDRVNLFEDPEKATYQRELAELQERQRRELEIIRQSKQYENELDEVQKLQQRERDQLALDQYRRTMEARLEITRSIAGDTSQAFADLYELTGRKQKEFFYLSKAAALAEVGVRTASGIMKAYEEMGAYGGIGAALVAVQGAIQTAKILSTNLAEGGIVPGSSPHSKADNIPANLTAGEYVQPVSVVKHYGVNAMELLRNKMIPKEAFYSASARFGRSPRLNYAEGGLVSSPVSGVPATRDNITIVNYTDRQELLTALSTKDGINAIVNVISSNREKVSRVLR